MNKPIMIDAFCGGGGCTKGYQQAGFYVVGVDNRPQPRYCGDEFIQADALEVLADRVFMARFDAAHASPPCQRFSEAQRIMGNDHPDLITPARELLEQWGRAWVIENVDGAPLIDPVELCGCMFPGQLEVYRSRLFETSWPFAQPKHRPHLARQAKMGRPVQPGEFMHVVGHFSDVKQARIAMGIDWMTRDELREAIPPAYARLVGEELFMQLTIAAEVA